MISLTMLKELMINVQDASNPRFHYYDICHVICKFEPIFRSQTHHINEGNLYSKNLTITAVVKPSFNNKTNKKKHTQMILYLNLVPPFPFPSFLPVILPSFAFLPFFFFFPQTKVAFLLTKELSQTPTHQYPTRHSFDYLCYVFLK